MIRAKRYHQQVAEVYDGDILYVYCTVERVYPTDNLQLELNSGNHDVSGRQSVVSSTTNRDGTFSVTKTFYSITFSRSYSKTEDGLICKVTVYQHQREILQSDRLQVTVLSCKYSLPNPERISHRCLFVLLFFYIHVWHVLDFGYVDLYSKLFKSMSLYRLQPGNNQQSNGAQ